MTAPTKWTPHQDSQIVLMRQAGESWGVIAKVLCQSRDSVLSRGRRLGLMRPAEEVQLAHAIAKMLPGDAAPDPSRDPYPAGHPIPWGIINTGLVLLADVPYAR